MYVGLHVKYTAFLSDFNQPSVFSIYFPKILISNFMNIRPVGNDLCHVNRQTDMTKLMAIFRNFANALNESQLRVKLLLLLLLLLLSNAKQNIECIISLFVLC